MSDIESKFKSGKVKAATFLTSGGTSRVASRDEQLSKEHLSAPESQTVKVDFVVFAFQRFFFQSNFERRIYFKIKKGPCLFKIKLEKGKINLFARDGLSSLL